MNIFIVSGHLGQEPEVKKFDSGKTLVTFKIASKEVYYNKTNEKVEETDWHYIKCWEANATIAEKYLNRGSFVTIHGKMKSESYQDKEGNKKYVSFVLAESLELPPKPKSEE